MKRPLKEILIKIARDGEQVLRAYELLAVRMFLFGMAVYGLFRAFGR
jgi:hypothetical protein